MSSSFSTYVAGPIPTELETRSAARPADVYDEVDAVADLVQARILGIRQACSPGLDPDRRRSLIRPVVLPDALELLQYRTSGYDADGAGRIAAATAAALDREGTPSLRSTAETWCPTVRSESVSLAAISASDRPSTRCPRMSS